MFLVYSYMYTCKLHMYIMFLLHYLLQYTCIYVSSFTILFYMYTCAYVNSFYSCFTCTHERDIILYYIKYTVIQTSAVSPGVGMAL